ncbi:unknown [[Mannheimia] succiniciproducens MBEL55E]|uniref:Uncharacterized protein n=1 Tax=Mannheimia succiniciproducens (strain KCTC 0769BP / MBEL55E) TaxID=221988 RepID=Q65T45_MANSM|nr:unknown [[Mannheimia] succiniciproducens MBEL55E]
MFFALKEKCGYFFEKFCLDMNHGSKNETGIAGL